MKKILLYGLLGIVVIFILIQFVPYGRQHDNPPVKQEPQWISQQTRDLAQQACFDCHSNETVWPWYSDIAPVSWFVANDVQEGRSYLNFSDWGRRHEEIEEVGEAISRGYMPPSYYSFMHPGAKLSTAEKQELINGLTATTQASR